MAYHGLLVSLGEHGGALAADLGGYAVLLKLIGGQGVALASLLRELKNQSSIKCVVHIFLSFFNEFNKFINLSLGALLGNGKHNLTVGR